MPLTCENLYHMCTVSGKGNANANDQGDHKSASIAQWLEHRQSNPAVTGSSPGGDEHICACHVEVKITSWQIKAMPSWSLLTVDSLQSSLLNPLCELYHDRTCLQGFRHTSVCAASEDGQRLEISNLCSRGTLYWLLSENKCVDQLHGLHIEQVAQRAMNAYLRALGSRYYACH